MLAYAANMPRAAGQAGSPKALTLIIAGHALALAAVLTAKPDLINLPGQEPTVLVNIKQPTPPPPEPTTDVKQRDPIDKPVFIDQESPIIDMERQDPIAVATGPTLGDLETVIGTVPSTLDLPKGDPVRVGPRFATSENAVKPPYPLDMRRLEKEATLQLRLTIDERGRVIAVDPVGPANPSFLEAARRHILRAWRYKPATEDGVAIRSTTLISLSFRLEDV